VTQRAYQSTLIKLIGTLKKNFRKKFGFANVLEPNASSLVTVLHIVAGSLCFIGFSKPSAWHPVPPAQRRTSPSHRVGMVVDSQRQICPSAFSRSAMRSSTSSIPTEYRTRPSGMPMASLSSGVDSTWLVVAGGPTMVSTAPKFAARWAY
jgi:hypothetical protein